MKNFNQLFDKEYTFSNDSFTVSLGDKSFLRVDFVNKFFSLSKFSHSWKDMITKVFFPEQPEEGFSGQKYFKKYEFVENKKDPRFNDLVLIFSTGGYDSNGITSLTIKWYEQDIEEKIIERYSNITI